MSKLDMGQAHINLLHYVLSHGCAVSIADPDWKESEDERKRVVGLQHIDFLISEIESWDGGQDFIVIDPRNKAKLWVGLAIGYGNEPHETVYDYSVGPILNDWFDQFMKEYCNE